MSYAIHNDQSEVRKAIAACKGQYQQAVVMGYEALSGATLKGKAKTYGGKYADSRRSLLRNLTAAGVKWSEKIGDHNKRILVIG